MVFMAHKHFAWAVACIVCKVLPGQRGSTVVQLQKLRVLVCWLLVAAVAAARYACLSDVSVLMTDCCSM